MKTAIAEEAVAEKVERLEREVATLLAELDRTRMATLASMLGPLRLREIVLLYVGEKDSARLVEDLSKDFGSWEVNQVIRHLFQLNHAPCSDDEREKFRAMFDHGMNKF